MKEKEQFEPEKGLSKEEVAALEEAMGGEGPLKERWEERITGLTEKEVSLLEKAMEEERIGGRERILEDDEEFLKQVRRIRERLEKREEEKKN